MLDPIAQLRQNAIRNISGILRAEVDADAFGADQLYDLLYFLNESLGRVFEQEVGFVKEEDHLGFVLIAHFRQFLKELREHPQKESGIEP